MAEEDTKKDDESQSEANSEEKTDEPAAATQEESESTEEAEEVSEEEEAKLKLPFPTAAVMRIMKSNMDSEKMIRKEVKVNMNKWLGQMCSEVSKQMNKFPYVMMHLNEFNEAKRVYEDLENFQKEKDRILAHFEAIKCDIEKLERDLGKEEGEVIIVRRKMTDDNA